nr:cytochrome c biogenesis CcmF C-terminal-like mitochondrial protein [Ipomoea trifida]
MKRKFLVLNTTSSVQKKEGMGESQKKALLQIDKPKRGKGVAMNNQPMPMMVNTSLIRSFYTESGMSLLRNAAFSAVRISKCIDWLDISISPSSSASEASTGVRNELASSSPQELSDNFNKNRILRFFQEKIEEIGGGGLPSSWSPEEFTRLVIGEEETTLTEEQGDENGDDVYLEAPPVKGQPGHDYYQKVNTNMKIPHGGVCLSTSGVLLSCDPAAYVRPVAHASYLFRAGGVNSDFLRVFNPAAEMLS